MPEESVGKVTHFFDKISVAVLSVTGNIKVGDKLKFMAKEPFEQTVTSMQIEHNAIQEAKPGDDIGMKTDKPVQKGAEVFKITEEAAG